jgi:Ca2+/Na+ antiporter
MIHHHHPSLRKELLFSTELIFRTKLAWLLLFGPIALLGDTGIFGASACFIFAGLTLIPLAERLSFVTEEVACHTSQTIGALLNATFGNAPELLISSAALREGFYRVVQLTLLGSILTNLLFVFGLSCLVGGLRYQVQELRIVSGNASIGMLMLAVSGLALPAALQLSNEMISKSEEREYIDKNGDGISDINDGPTYSMIGFSRFNAILMISGYLMYLLFQLGSHRDEFEDATDEEDDEEEDDAHEGEGHMMQSHSVKAKKKLRQNKYCYRLFQKFRRWGGAADEDDDTNIMYDGLSTVEMESPKKSQALGRSVRPGHILRPMSGPQCRPLGTNTNGISNGNDEEASTVPTSNAASRRRVGLLTDQGSDTEVPAKSEQSHRANGRKSHCSDGSETYIFPLDMPREEEGKLYRCYSVYLIVRPKYSPALNQSNRAHVVPSWPFLALHTNNQHLCHE